VSRFFISTAAIAVLSASRRPCLEATALAIATVRCAATHHRIAASTANAGKDAFGNGVDVRHGCLGRDRVPARVPECCGSCFLLAVVAVWPLQVGDAEMTARRCAARLDGAPRAAITMWTFMIIGLGRQAVRRSPLDLRLAPRSRWPPSYAVATSLNDIADVDIDRTNGSARREQPLVLGDASAPGDLRGRPALPPESRVAAALPLGARRLAVIGLCLAVDVATRPRPRAPLAAWTLAPIVLTAAYVGAPLPAGDRRRARRLGRRRPAARRRAVRAVLRADHPEGHPRPARATPRTGSKPALLRLASDATCAVSVPAPWRARPS
jgi:hypothetical protein